MVKKKLWEMSDENQEEVEFKRPMFGNRLLTDGDYVFKHNAWDHVEWDEEQERAAAEAVAKNSAVKLSAEERSKFLERAPEFWDSFYNTHENRFFKDRHWLFTEFPELLVEKPQRVFEMGCGVGNTIIPLLQHNQKMEIFGCDFSARAIEILRENPHYESARCQVFVMDATLEDWSTQQLPFEENSLDIIIFIFMLSAIPPAKFQTVLRNCYRYLRPGGMVLLRDYGRHDLAQLRFKSGKCLADNNYVRGDGTLVYFFTLDELKKLFIDQGFEVVQSLVDRRMQVNRSRFLKMYRVWLQAKFKKPEN